jgi:hypothetical protein
MTPRTTPASTRRAAAQLAPPIVWAALATLLGCNRAAPATQKRRPDPSRLERMASIDARDGIDAREASTIAGIYFETFVAEAGWTDPPARVGELWRATVRWGMNGQPRPDPIEVDARTGAVQMKGHLRLADVAELEARLRAAEAARKSWRSGRKP